MADTASQSTPVSAANFEDVAAERATLGTSILRVLRLLWRPEMMKWRAVIIAAFLITIVAKVLSVTGPLFLGEGINQLAAGGDGVFAAFFSALIAFAGARFLASAIPYFRDAIFTEVTQDANRLISVEAFRHANHLPLSFHVTRRSGALNRIIERGAGATEYLLRFLGFNIGPTIVELSLAAVVLSVAYGIGFSVIAVVTVVIYVVFTVIVTEWRVRQRRILNEADTELRARAMDSLANFETVKAFAAEDREAERYDAAQIRYNREFVRNYRSLSILNAGQELIMTLGLFGVLALAGWKVAEGTGEIGAVTAAMLMLLNIYRPMNILGWAWREIKQGTVDLEKLFGLLDLKAEVRDAPEAGELAVHEGRVTLDHVSFSHPGRAVGVEAISMDIAPGSFVGIVGPSGAGKSTLLRLLLRLYDPSTGRVLIDGQDARHVTQQSWRRCIGVVPQEVVLFNDTLRVNLAYGRPDASDDELMAAAEKAQLKTFIDALPEGLDTRVGERGLKLSGGEKQRVGLARAILTDPPILVLDEATSSLDSQTEREVQKALRDAARGRTTIAVAHRLSTIADADRIYVLEDGQLREQGTHGELLQAGGRYAQLWHSQAEGREQIG